MTSRGKYIYRHIDSGFSSNWHIFNGFNHTGVRRGFAFIPMIYIIRAYGSLRNFSFLNPHTATPFKWAYV